MRRHVRLSARLVLLSALSCSGCAAPAVKLVQPAPQPAQVWLCQPAPPPPADPYTDQQLAVWVASGFAAGQDCRDHLTNARIIVEGK